MTLSFRKKSTDQSPQFPSPAHQLSIEEAFRFLRQVEPPRGFKERLQLLVLSAPNRKKQRAYQPWLGAGVAASVLAVGIGSTAIVAHYLPFSTSAVPMPAMLSHRSTPGIEAAGAIRVPPQLTTYGSLPNGRNARAQRALHITPATHKTKAHSATNLHARRSVPASVKKDKSTPLSVDHEAR